MTTCITAAILGLALRFDQARTRNLKLGLHWAYRDHRCSQCNDRSFSNWWLEETPGSRRSQQLSRMRSAGEGRLKEPRSTCQQTGISHRGLPDDGSRAPICRKARRELTGGRPSDDASHLNPCPDTVAST